MKFRVLTNRWANFYFFLQNLSEWHYRVRTSYNILWRKELGQFSDKEEESLKMFKEIHSRYSFGENYLANYFLVESGNPWIHMKNYVSSVDLNSLQDIFKCFEEKFERLYQIDLPLFKKWGAELTKHLKDTKLNKKIVKALSILYKVSPQKKEVLIYLLFSSENESGGRFHPERDCITVELSRIPISRINHIVGIIWHELIHLYFDRVNFIPLLSEKIKDEKTIHLLKEVAAGSLFPDGILGMKFLSTSPPHQLSSEIKPELTSDILKITAQYLDRNCSFDENYIDQILNILKK